MTLYHRSYLFMVINLLFTSQSSFGMFRDIKELNISTQEILERHAIAKNFIDVIINAPDYKKCFSEDIPNLPTHFMKAFLRGESIAKRDPQLLNILIAKCVDLVDEATLSNWLALEESECGPAQRNYLGPIKEVAAQALLKKIVRKRDAEYFATNNNIKNAATKLSLCTKYSIVAGIISVTALAYYWHTTKTNAQEK